MAEVEIKRTTYEELVAMLPNRPSSISHIMEHQAMWTQDVAEHASEKARDLSTAKREVLKAQHAIKEAQARAFLDARSNLKKVDGKAYSEGDAEAHCEIAPEVLAARKALYEAMRKQADAEALFDRWDGLKWNFKEKSETAKILWEQIKTGYLRVRQDWSHPENNNGGPSAGEKLLAKQTKTES